MVSKFVNDSQCESLHMYHLGRNFKEALEQGKLKGRFENLQSIVVKIEECGVDLNKKVCDLTPDAIQMAEFCLVFESNFGKWLTKGIHSQLLKKCAKDDIICFPASSMLILGNKGHPSANDQKAVILLSTCDCSVCLPMAIDAPTVDLSGRLSDVNQLDRNPSLPFLDRYRIQTWDFRPVIVTMKMESVAGVKVFQDLEFKPGYTFKTTTKDPKCSDVAPHRYNMVYYANVNLKDVELFQQLKEQTQPEAKKLKIKDQKDPKCLRPQITVLDIKQKLEKGQLGIKRPLTSASSDENVADPDFTIVSPDDEEHHCHQAVLRARSAYFESMFSFEIWKEEKSGKINLPKEIMSKDGVKFTGKTVEALLNFIYYEEEGTKFQWDLEVAAGLVKLAHYYQINDLLREAALAVFETLVSFETETYLANLELPSVGVLLDLYQLVRLLDGVELMHHLKTAIIIAFKIHNLAKYKTRAPTSSKEKLEMQKVLDAIKDGDGDAIPD